MARHRSTKKKGRIKRIRSNESYFKTSSAKTIEQFIVAALITGMFTGLGTMLGSVLGKYLLNEAQQTLPPGVLPQSFMAAIKSI